MTSSAAPTPPQHVDSMATELESRCPICLDSWQEAAYVMPCLHQFCHPCITRWAETKPECPLCKGMISSILHSVRADDDFKELVIAPPPAAQPPAMLPPPTAPLGGFHDYDWASIFRDYPSVFQALVPWLQQELEQLFEDMEEVTAVQGRIMIGLHCYGLDGEALTQMLWVTTSRQTRSFIQRLVAAAVHLCSGEAQHQMALAAAPAAEEWEGSPAAAPSPAASPGAHSSTDLQGGPSSAPSAPIPTHGVQEERRDHPEEAVAGPSTQSWSSQHCPGQPRRAPKRRAGNPDGTSQPCKKAPHRH